VVEVISDADLRSFGLVYLPLVEVGLVDVVEFFGWGVDSAEMVDFAEAADGSFEVVFWLLENGFWILMEPVIWVA